MFNPHLQDDLSEGRRRYGSRLNEMVGWKCPKCGSTATASSVYDEKICMKAGCGAKMERQNSEGQSKLLHEWDANGKCKTCGISKDKIENAAQKYLIVDDFGNEQGYGEFDSLQEAEKFLRSLPSYKSNVLLVVKNGIGSQKENALEKCALCGHAHDGDVCDDCDCRIFQHSDKLENAKRICPDCGKELTIDEANMGAWGNGWKCSRHGAVAVDRILYNEVENAGNYLAECGHCSANTEHDIKTHRCTICGAKNDAVENDDSDRYECVKCGEKKRSVHEKGEMCAGCKLAEMKNATECDRCYKPMKQGEGTLAPDDQIVCDECIKKYDNENNAVKNDLGYQYETSTTTAKRGVECPTCGQKFYEVKDLKAHTSSAHIVNELKNAFECPECGNNFDVGSGLFAHLIDAHGYTDNEAMVATTDREGVR